VVVLALAGLAFRLAKMRAQPVAPRAEPDKLEWPEQATLTLRPAALPEPALKYRLLPPVSEQTPGNAATVYLLAFADGAQIDFHQVEKYLSMPLDQSTRRKADEYLARYKDAIRHLEVAGRRSYCQWQDPLREEGGFETTLWHSRNGRLLARVLALRARLEIADRRFDAALRTLQTGFAEARFYTRDASWGPTKGATDADGILKAFLDRVREWVQAEGSPNLYWALANLPRPMADRRNALEVEDAGVYWSFPELRRPDQLTEEHARAVLEKIWHALGEKRDGQNAHQLSREAASRLLPKARRRLIDSGQKPELVEAIPPTTAVLIYMVDEYRRAADEVYKWAGVPYAQAINGLEASLERFQQARKAAPDNPLLQTMVNVSNQFLLCAMRDREAALLQCVEALRAYAAAHGGKLPKSLEELSPGTPAPLDPLLGKPFDYQVKDDTVTLRAASPFPGFQGSGRVYQVLLKP
jgi:hypothetical protein